MTAFTLYYHPLPFRGQFVRWVLAYGNAAWDEAEHARVIGLKMRPVADQTVPHMAPPVLVDHKAGLALAQLPAILAHLGDCLALAAPGRAGQTLKVICDANDVLDELTRHGGQQMWDRPAWEDFWATRLPRWMEVFAETGRREGLSAESGTLLGTDRPSLADLVTGCLWFTMADKLPGLWAHLQAHAPEIAALSRHIAEQPAVAALRARTDAAYGAKYCGGQIEQSLRDMLTPQVGHPAQT